MKIMNSFLFELKKAAKEIVLFFAIFCASLVSAQIIYPFSTCGATGNIGPTAPQIAAGYLGTTLAGSVTVSGGIQSFVIPITGPYRIDAMGAGGGGVAPGCGARMVGEFNLTAGTVLRILVGQKGILESGYTRNLGASGGGGGGSFVVSGGTPLVIAGGGGGSGCDNAGTGGITASSAPTTGPLNNGGTFGEGNPGAGYSGNAALGLHLGTTIGFSFLNGGVGGVGASGGGTGYGGFGCGGGEGYADGGGGGGVSGGNTRPDGSGGHGGGSSNTGTSQVNTAGFNCAQGSVILTLLYSVAISETNTISCNSYSTSVLSATVSGGLAPYTYSWVPAGGTASVTSGLPAGTYTCFVKDALLNPTSNTFTVTEPASFSITASVTNSAICNGGTTVFNGAGASTYTWTGGVINGATFTPTVTDTYSVVGYNALGCKSSNTVALTVIVNPGPVITVNSGAICAGQSFTIVPAGASTYTFQGGSSVVSPIVNSTYTVVGTTTAGCISSMVTSSVTINANPIITVNSGSICAGNSFTISPAGASTYTVQGGSFVVNPMVNSTYTVVGTNLAGCISPPVTSTLVIELSTITITAVATPSAICSSQSSILSASGGVTYLWSPGAGLSSPSGSSTNTTPNVTTIYTVVATDALGCISSASVTVNVTPTPTLVLTASSTTICEGSTTNLQASGASNYLWSPSGSLSSSTLPSVIATPATTTLYSVIGNNGVCTDSKNIQITVVPKIIPMITPNDTAICFGKTIQLSASGGNQYLWSPASTLSSPTSANVIAKPLTTTIYTVSVSLNNNCPQTKSIKITVNPLPYVYAGADTTINIDESYILHGTGNVEVGFVPLDGIPLNCNYCSSVEVNPKVNTCYTLKGITNFGCENSDDVCITVTKDYNIYIPNAFTPNGDTDNDVFMPVGYGLESYEMSIFDRWGNTIFKSSSERKGWDGSVKGKLAEAGVYVYRIVFKTMGNLEVTKVGHLTVLSRVK